LVAATVGLDLALAGAFAGLLASFLVSFALVFFGGTVAYLPPEQFGASTPEFRRNFIHCQEKSSQKEELFS
jgi:hypothetical protein